MSKCSPETENLPQETQTNSKKGNVLTKKATPKFMTAVYIAIIVFCMAFIAGLSVLVILRVNKNAQLKAEVDAIVEKYNIETVKYNNLSDPDYAEIYFEGNVIYIPNEDIVIEYQP